jgi:Nucleotidyl transferase AbiEii toxin, Type IV TA system
VLGVDAELFHYFGAGGAEAEAMEADDFAVEADELVPGIGHAGFDGDIDFDVHTVARHTLQKNVNQILGSSGFRRILSSFSIELTKLSQPKQTDTTQRWKIHLRYAASETDFPTRIEFSRRTFDPGVIFGPVDGEIVAAYHLRPILASHYDIEAAFRQKVEALLHRKETQARDVFDLSFLLERGAKGATNQLGKKQLAKACEIALSVPFDQFRSQVVAYLAPEYQEYYGNRRSWDSLQEKVVRTLENL